ncbi:MAG: hypothetical protein J07HQW2_03168 [Haloquadratum walsbyi J07HQW2]|uniref:Uncharacterized protein n=1 Tax=Haloquadratum walsbyi J07HQW2 TaxID=1238425 RepID=U1NHM2_9EURY|nr:MAG: hypothetical protein J07HQW2_03168 [Haloquadratum walsbyi J07HQW2]
MTYIKSHINRLSIFLQRENPGVYAGRESDNSATNYSLTTIRICNSHRSITCHTPRRFHRPPNCTISGFRDPECSRHPLEPLWCLGEDNYNSESPAGIGVTAVWLGSAIGSSCRRVVTQQISHPTPAERCGAVRYRGKPHRLPRGGGHE